MAPSDAAARRLDAAIARAERAADISSVFRLLELRGRYADEAGDRAEVARLRGIVGETADRLRASYRSRAGRLWAAQQTEKFVSELLAAELSDGPLDNATFQKIEGIKARCLLDALRTRGTADPAGALDADAGRAERELFSFAPPDDELGPLLRDIRLACVLPIGDSWDSDGRRSLVSEVELAYAGLGVQPAPAAPVSELHDVQAALRADETLLEFFLPPVPPGPRFQVWAAVITAERADLANLGTFHRDGFYLSLSTDGRAPVESSALGNAVVLARHAIQRAAEAEDPDTPGLLAVLGQVLITPLLDRGLLTAERPRLVIVPQHVLHAVPFAAVPGIGGQPLIEDFAISLAPSASVWHRMQTAPRPPVTTFVGLANPEIRYTDVKPLTGGDQELERVQASLSGLQILAQTGAGATEEYLRTVAHRAGIMLISTHGEFPEDDALDMQRILLAASSEHDGSLHAEEIRALDLRAARLITLSVCNGSLYRFGPGDEPYGLLPAFLVAGAENVISTFWAIEDDIGRLFMEAFYGHLASGDGPAEALRQSGREFRADGALTRQWSAFSCVGPGRPFPFGP